MQSVLVEEANLELGTVDTNSLLTLLECPVCLDHITPPIKQCTKVNNNNTRQLLKTETYPPRVTWFASTASPACLIVRHVGRQWQKRGTWGWSR